LARLERRAISGDDETSGDVEAGSRWVFHCEAAHERSFGWFKVYWVEADCEYFDQVLVGTRLG
jgi:hypothetical protein